MDPTAPHSDASATSDPQERRSYVAPRFEEHGPLVRLTKQKSPGASDGMEGSGEIPPP